MKQIYALGTSHTFGVCRGEENGLLETTWTDILSKRLKRPVINYGRRGINNLQIIEMAEKIAKEEQPDLIIAEMRWTTHPIMVEDHRNPNKSTDLFSLTRHFEHEKNEADSYSSKYKEIHYGWAKHMNRLEEKMNLEWIEDLDKDFLESLKGFIKINFNHNVFQDQYKRQALSNMYHLQSICDKHNIPLKIFVWTASNYNDLSKSNFDMSGLSTFGFFENGRTFIEYIGPENSDPYKCECEHFKTPVHMMLVDEIEEEVNDALR
mgnify:CR=1 FL=1